MTKKILFCFGFGYSCAHLAQMIQEKYPDEWEIRGTTRDPEKRDYYRDKGVKLYLHDALSPSMDMASRLEEATHILISAPPDKEGDPVFRAYADEIAASKNLQWLGYFSTTGIYGNREGRSVTETSEVRPSTIRGSRRAEAEKQWLILNRKKSLPLHIFRLSGIYGPDRSAIESVKAGLARRIYKEDHVFNRIHVKDICNVVLKSFEKPTPGQIYNVADDEPAPSHEIIAYACELMGRDLPPLIPIEEANLVPITMSFYSDNKRVDNSKVKDTLIGKLEFPTYREGLQNCLEESEKQSEQSDSFVKRDGVSA